VNFVDTNVFIYALADDQPEAKHSRAIELLESSDLAISTQVLNELSATLRNKSRLPEDALQSIVESLLRRYEVTVLNIEDILEAFLLRKEYQLSYWDSLIVASALRSNANILYSEDMQDGLIIRGRMTVINPFR
jgi:predicted nucleic acid-binding protein